MHRIENAIIMAAGIGQRMRPVTLETPKPLIPVNGVRMIDTVIQGLHANGIQDITVVTGYLKEKFDVLKDQYPDVRLVENPYYDTCNNISSLYCAREYLGNTMILDGDQMIYDPKILSADFERSGYNAVWTDEATDEWLMTVEDGIVTHCSRTGGNHGWQLFSISRWTKEDSTKLRRHLEKEFDEKQNRNIYWDDVAMFCYPEEYRLGVWPMEKEAMQEIDSLDELIETDASYRRYKEVVHG